MAISKISKEERLKMYNKSAGAMPNVPSEKNWKPDTFKRYIIQPLFDEVDSFYAYYNRMATEVDEIVEEIHSKKDNTNIFSIDKDFTKLDELCNEIKTLSETNGEQLLYVATLNNSPCICSINQNKVYVYSLNDKIIYDLNTQTSSKTLEKVQIIDSSVPNGSYLSIESGGELTLTLGSSLNVESGSTLRIEDGAMTICPDPVLPENIANKGYVDRKIVLLKEDDVSTAEVCELIFTY